MQCFSGFANFYKIFIKEYCKIAALLTCLTWKDKFVWNEKVEEVFKALKKAFTSVSILVHVDPSKPFFIEIDASNFVLDLILFKYGKDGQLYYIAYCS